MNCYITLDYELCMGDITGTPEKCLVEPMDCLTSMVDKYGIKMNVFVDAAYLLRLKQLKGQYPQLEKDWNTVTNHVKELDREGHAIQLHLHPQWCYSNYDGQRWVLDKDHYKLSDMPLSEQKQLIHDGVALLNGLVAKPVAAFRAGGYSIENFPDLYETFIEEGIVVDTSAIRGERAKGKYQTYDYRSLPMRTSYRFRGNHKIENKDGMMMEYPISTKVIPAILYLYYKKSKNKKLKHIIASKKAWRDGVGIGYPGNRFQVMLTKLGMLLGKKSLCTYIEVPDHLDMVYDCSIKKYKGNDFVIIGHPKSISPYSIAVFELFIQNHMELNFKLFKK